MSLANPFIKDESVYESSRVLEKSVVVLPDINASNMSRNPPQIIGITEEPK